VREGDTVALGQPEGEGVKEVEPVRLPEAVALEDAPRDEVKEGQEEEEPVPRTLRDTVVLPEGLPVTLLDPQWLLERVGEVVAEREAQVLPESTGVAETEPDRAPVADIDPENEVLGEPAGLCV
jgi:hypothetical protein